MKQSLWTVAVIILVQASASAQTASHHQARARPFGLDIVDTVKMAGSDARSADFQANHASTLLQTANQRLGERQSIGDISGIALDPNALRLSTAATVRAYFVSEGAGYHNTLGFNTSGTPQSDGQLIFPDASMHRNRSMSYPLQTGDFVDLGTFEAGTLLDFFVIANGARRGTNTYSTQTSLNPDGIGHVVALAVPDSPYLLIGFEDLYGGGDRDFNDVVFTIDVGEQNVRRLSGAPEPGTMTIVGTVSAVLAVRNRRRAKLSKFDDLAEDDLAANDVT